MPLPKQVGDQSPQAKRGTAQDWEEYSKGDVQWANDGGPAARNVQPDPFRHLDANDSKEDGTCPS